MTDSTDKKSNDKRDNLKVDLDAMLDEAESSLLPMSELQDDEDAIDRLLMDAGFDVDDELEQAAVNADARVVENVDLHDDLDDFLGFDNFSNDFNEPEKAQAVESGELEQAVESLAVSPLNEPQDAEDELDRLLMNTSLDVGGAASAQSNAKEDINTLEELDDFSDFSDFNEPDIIAAAEAEVSEQVGENLSSSADDVGLLDESDEFADGFDESDLIQEDEVAANEEKHALIDEPDQVEDAGEIDELDDFSDFSDFNEPDTSAATEIEGFTQENLPSSTDDVGLPDEADDFSDLFADGFDESDLIQDDQVSAVSTPATEDLVASNEEEQDDFSGGDDFNKPDIASAVEVGEPGPENLSSSVEDAGLSDSDEVDDFSDLFNAGLDESDLNQDDEINASAQVADAEASEQAGENLSSSVEAAGLPDADEADDFSDLFNAGLDESDLIQDDEVKASAQVADAEASEQADENLSSSVDDVGLSDEADEFADLFIGGFDQSDLIQDDEVAVNEEKQATVAESFNDLVDDESSFDNLLSETGFDVKDALEQTDELADENEVDDFSGFADDFNESDLLLDDESEAALAPDVADEEKQAADEESFNDLQNDEGGFDSLFTDVGFDAEETSEQASTKKDEFGDDADLNDFFQLDGGNNDFSEQVEETEKSLTEEDDFLLPDFDITADTEMSDIGGKQDEFADAFGETDFLNEDETVQAFEPGATELKSVSDDTAVPSEPKQSADTAIESIENAQMNRFEFEREDMQRQLEEAEKKVKKAKLFGYLALGFGGVALSAATGLGVMTYGAKTEVSKLTETVSNLQASLDNKTVTPPNEEINAMRNSVVQLNQQVNGFISELKGNPQFLADLLNNKVPDIAAKQDMVSKALEVLQVKVGVEGKGALEPAVAEPSKIEAAREPAPVKEEPAHDTAPVKAEALPDKKEVAHEPAPAKEGATHKTVPAKENDTHATAPAKAAVVPEAAPDKAKTQPEPVAAKPGKPVISPKAVVNEEPVKEKRPEAIGKWGVNLVAFKQEWFAKSKAAEFARQGVFAEVIPVYEKNTTMYRLRVGGFKTKAEANANTARIKQALNLDSVWVSDN